MEYFAKLVPLELKNESGLVFYSGRAAFEGTPPIYLIGASPGGDRGLEIEELVHDETQKALQNPNRFWSSYLDATWSARGPGQEPMQKRLAHMFESLGIDLRHIPSSNLIFSRSRSIAEIGADFDRLASLCWPFHQAVIDQLKPRIVLCMGDDAGSYVRKKLNARQLLDHYVEDNNRGWRSTAYAGEKAPVVVTVTHPSRAAWTNPKSDPTALVSRILKRSA
ncbi:uracil-DNA glycosylase family protein [Asticcacaulis sp. AC402]|uniref:uracil-DNA glycosylase family protein n=1 Tax=Asticcacaulis sp. AC402 TaxID=1282361 RepID=UPI0003C40FF8|nr:uracil-DNA glycosylase family protein [Asticcacaulis sp. AC402]ESQ75032.1 hypothetical protein ABAC402_11550 [Asticcacaulis sp. AC402]